MELYFYYNITLNSSLVTTNIFLKILYYLRRVINVGKTKALGEHNPITRCPFLENTCGFFANINPDDVFPLGLICIYFLFFPKGLNKNH